MAEKAVVFDKAAWHLDSVREHGLDDHQACVHGGLFFGWAVDRGLVAPWLAERTPEAFAAYRAGALSGPGLLAVWDGAIVDDQFTDVGLAFVAEYFDPRTGAFFSDYLGRLAKGLPSDYHVRDTPENAAAVAAFLDERFSAWRKTWDAATGRPDLRYDLTAVASAVADGQRLPVLAVTSGVVLPHGPLGIRASRPDTVKAVERALREHRTLVLVATEVAGRHPDPQPADLLDVGVLARVEQVVAAADKPGSRDVVLQCLGRVRMAAWSTDDGLSAVITEVPPLEPGPDDEALLETVRRMATEVVRSRAVRGIPPGSLGLATVVRGEALLDVVARELALSREERLLVLVAPALADRAHTVVQALSREAS